MRKLFLLITSILISSNFILAKSKVSKIHAAWEEKYVEFSVKYTQGYYKDVADYARKLSKQIRKSEYKNDYHLAKVYLWEALGYEGLNKFETRNSNLDSALIHYNRISNDSISQFYNASSLLSFYYIEVGQAAKAASLGEKLQDFFLQKRLRNYVLNIQRVLITAYVKQGKYNEATALLKEVMPYVEKLASNNKLDESGNPAKDKVSKNMMIMRKKQYASLLNVSTEIALLRGDYKQAEIDARVNEEIIKDYVKKKSDEYRDYLALKAEFYLATNNHKLASKFYMQSYKIQGFKKFEKQRLILNEKLVGEYAVLNKISRYKKYLRTLQLTSKRAYSKTSYPYADYLFVDVKRQLVKNYNHKAQNKLGDLFEEISSLPKNNPYRIKYLEAKYELALRIADIKEAENVINELLDLQKELVGENSPEYHKVLLKKAEFLIKYSNNFDQVAQIKSESFDKIVAPQITTTNNSYPQYLNTFAKYYELKENFKIAKDIYQKAEYAVEDRYSVTDINYGSELSKYSSILIKLGEYTKADSLLKKALTIAKEHKNQDDPRVIEIYQSTASLLNKLGDYEYANKLLIKAFDASNRIKKQGVLMVAESADELAKLYLLTERYSDAEDLLNDAIALKEGKLGFGNKDLISTLYLMGKVQLILGNYAESEKSIKRALEISNKVFSDSSLNGTEGLLLLKELYVAIGDYPKAEQFAKKVYHIQKRLLGISNVQTAQTGINIAMIKLQRKNATLTDIEKLLLQNGELIKKSIGVNNPIYQSYLGSLAHYYTQTNSLKKADTLLAQENQYWIDKFSKFNIHSPNIWLERGEIAIKLDKIPEAESYFEKSISVYGNIFGENHPDYVNATSKLAQIQFIKGDLKKAIGTLEETTDKYLNFTKLHFPTLSFREKSKYWNKINGDFEFYNTLAMKLYADKPSVVSSVYNNTINTKALLLSSTIRMKHRIISSGDTNLINKFNQWIDLKESLTSAISFNSQQQQEMGINVKEMEKQLESLEKELSEKSEDFAENELSKVITWKDVRNALKPNEYAIEIIRFRNFTKSFTDSVVYAALIVSPETKSQPEVVIIPNGSQLEKRYIKYFTNAIRFNNDDKYSYDMFWKAIKAKIPDGANIYLSADGVYNQLNMEMLKNKEGKYVIDLNSFTLVSNTKEIAIRAQAEKLASKHKVKAVVSGVNLKSDEFVICANPQFYESTTEDKTKQSISSLEGAENEAKDIESICKSNKIEVKILIGDKAEENTLKELKSPKLLHFATHAYFNQEEIDENNENEFATNPMLNSGLLLANAGDLLDDAENANVNSKSGVLTAYEASSMSLDNTDVVIMSACETGLGQVQVGEGVAGLQRAFQEAGAKTVVMTLFKVNDNVTRKFMKIFYSKWLNGTDKRIAFAETKREIKKEFPQPIYWGSFVMIGVK